MSVCTQTYPHCWVAIDGVCFCRTPDPVLMGQESPAPDSYPNVERMRLTVALQTIDILLQQRAEQDERIALLCRQVRALQHGRIAAQRAHNVLAGHVEQIEDAHNRLVVYAEHIEADRG